MKFKKILIYFILSIFFSYPIVVLAQTYVPADCADQKDYDTNKYKILQCITCENRIIWEVFLDSYDKNLTDDIEHSTEFIQTYNNIEGLTCDEGQVVIIGIKTLPQPDTTNSDLTQSPDENDTTNTSETDTNSFKKLHDDLFEIFSSNRGFSGIDAMFISSGL